MGTGHLLSQCMIVRNEEENIARALAWGKSIAFEQIVVDTGSNDRTVEIAESLGAKVFHFPWADDFSAAKNFALDQASGEWIAFLDADEYMPEKDAGLIFELLKDLSAGKYGLDRYDAVRCKIEHLDDNGKVFSTGVHIRFFQNKKDMRYQNRIHEALSYSSGKAIVLFDAVKNIGFKHTGYASKIYAKAGKAERNIQLLKKEVQNDPDNTVLLEYLAESYVAAGRDAEALELLERLLEQFEKGEAIFRQDHVFFLLIRIVVERDRISDTLYIERLYRIFRSTESLYPDIDYLMGMWSSRYQRWGKAKEYLELALEKSKIYTGSDTIYMIGELETIYYVLAMACQESGELANAVKYCVLSLQKNLFSERVLLPLLTILKQDEATTYQAILEFLKKIYDFNQLKHRLFLLKCAKMLSFTQLVDEIYDSLNQEELAWLEDGDETTVKTFATSNVVDETFISIGELIKHQSCEQLISAQREKLEKLKKEQNENYDKLLKFIPETMVGNALSPERGVYDGLVNRIHALKNNWEEFQWLYGSLTDYRSRKVLVAIIKNWMEFDFGLLGTVRADSLKYFDLDLISSGKDDTFVDIGAYTGDTVIEFVRTYGDGYRHIYCYEPAEATVKILKRNLRKYPKIDIRNMAVNDVDGLVNLQVNENSFYNRIMKEEGTPVNAVSLDSDMTEPPTFIKINTGGTELEVLEGCKEHIKRNHPKLVICVDHNYDDLWKIPKLIHEMDSSYKFYLRYYGGNLFPTEIVLTAL